MSAAGVLGYVYVYFWVKRANVRAFVERGAQGLLLAFLLLLLLDVILEFYGFKWARNPAIVFKALFVAAITIALYNRIREWSDRRQQTYFIEAAKKLVELLSATQGHDEVDATVDSLLAIIRKTFERKGRPNANLALRCEDDAVEIKYCHPPDAVYQTEFRLGSGQGAAGYCCEHQCVVYIPRKSIRHAIVQNIRQDRPYDMVAELYVPNDGTGVSFQSVLCVPLVAYGKCFGVLNLDSRKSNPFSVLDFEQALFYGLIVAQLLHLNSFHGHAAGTAAPDS